MAAPQCYSNIKAASNCFSLFPHNSLFSVVNRSQTTKKIRSLLTMKIIYYTFFSPQIWWIICERIENDYNGLTFNCLVERKQKTTKKTLMNKLIIFISLLFQREAMARLPDVHFVVKLLFFVTVEKAKIISYIDSTLCCKFYLVFLSFAASVVTLKVKSLKRNSKHAFLLSGYSRSANNQHEEHKKNKANCTSTIFYTRLKEYEYH